MQLTPEQEQQERENSNLLASIGNVDAQIARRVLRKHRGDMDKAADAILAGDRGAEAWETQHRTTPEPMYTDGTTPVHQITQLPSTSVIDLTADDDETMAQAMKMSLMDQSSQSSVHFGPTDRAPHPEWQMVPSNAPVGGVSAEDRGLDDAIQASLQDFHKEEEDTTPLEPVLREGNRPTVLRHESPSLAYAALLLQAIYYIPQARSIISTMRLPDIQESLPLDHEDRALWNLIELFTNMDLAQLSLLMDVSVIPSLRIPPFDGTRELSLQTAEVVREISILIQEHLGAQVQTSGLQEEPDRLFSFTHGRVTLAHNRSSKLDRSRDIGVTVPVTCGGDSTHNDLVSCLTDMLITMAEGGGWNHDVIITPSEALAFEIRRLPNAPGKASPDPLIYPKTLYLDRFLFDNVSLVNEKRSTERKTLRRIRELSEYKEKLTRHNGRDTLQDLRASIHYYEHVADRGNDPVRQRTLERTAAHLKDVMTMILGKVEDIDHQVELLQTEVAAIYDCPELQQFDYDLRSVLVHTGLPGRKQIYSYVQDVEGTWWKTVDCEVTEVPEETVLSDPTGLHMGAGPYMLFYSRHLSDEQLHEPLVWPNIFSSAVEENNKQFLAMVHPELGIFAKASVPEPPQNPRPTTPRELPSIPTRPVVREHSRSITADERSPQLR
ncbi:unnamed protein product [Cyclocybe aegerita]|uniref:Peptidase C19 ubiquitin carboxyl-terminal hydrolase domain-containing protein n=1 Tax=Cyclocybe aegerita TaxID=1973307 RepID=A0A8S0X3T9_CYCAE|nr:unnamed protein product [Cyclocybe aegerita]